MKKIFFKALIAAIFFLLPLTSQAASLSGRILLQVQSRGEAWYINPLDNKRYYLGSPADAYDLMRKMGLGITNRDFYRAASIMPSRLLGRILLKVEDRGRAYYVDPTNSRLYYLGSADEAYQVIRSRGLGITNVDLSKITISPTSAIPPSTAAATPPPTVGANEKLVNYTWKYKDKNYTLSEVLNTDLYNSYKNSPKYLSYPAGSPPANLREAFYALFLTIKEGDGSLDKLLAGLQKMAVTEGFSESETIEFIMAFVQYIPYDTLKAQNASPDPNFFYETLYRNSGICSDKSFLGVMLLRKLGYGAELMDYPTNKHTAVGIICPTADSTAQSGYCYIETTNFFPIGIVPQSLSASGVAQTDSGDIDNLFDSQSLGVLEVYQKTSGKSYEGIGNTKVKVDTLRGLKNAISTSNADLATAKTTLESAKTRADALYAQLLAYQASGNRDDYNNLVPEYNVAAADYNNQAANYQLKINIYNQYVSQYNNGLKELFQN